MATRSGRVEVAAKSVRVEGRAEVAIKTMHLKGESKVRGQSES